MLWRDGFRGAIRIFRGMGVPGIVVAACFAIASTCFVVALGYTTVANILLMQAGVPLFAALLAWAVFREKVSGRAPGWPSPPSSPAWASWCQITERRGLPDR